MSSSEQYTHLISSGHLLAEISHKGLYFDAALSPNDSQIAVMGMLIFPEDDTTGEIYVMNIDGSNITRLTHNNYPDRYPTWSPNGQRLAFAYNDHDVWGIAVMNVDGSNQVRITQETAHDEQPNWSPDGQRIVFVSDRDGTQNIYTINPDASNLIQLTQGAGNNKYPKWSPDGNFISFSSDRDGNGNEIYLVNGDRSNVRRLTNNTYDDRSQCWLMQTEPPRPISTSTFTSTNELAFVKQNP